MKAHFEVGDLVTANRNYKNSKYLNTQLVGEVIRVIINSKGKEECQIMPIRLNGELVAADEQLSMIRLNRCLASKLQLVSRKQPEQTMMNIADKNDEIIKDVMLLIKVVNKILRETKEE